MSDGTEAQLINTVHTHAPSAKERERAGGGGGGGMRCVMSEATSMRVHPRGVARHTPITHLLILTENATRCALNGTGPIMAARSFVGRRSIVPDTDMRYNRMPFRICHPSVGVAHHTV